MTDLAEFLTSIQRQVGENIKNVQMFDCGPISDLNTADNLKQVFVFPYAIRVIALAATVTAAATGANEVITLTDGTSAITVTLATAGAPTKALDGTIDQKYDADTELTLSNGGASTGGATIGSAFVFYVIDEIAVI